MPRDATPAVSRPPRRLQVHQRGQEKLIAVVPAGFSENVKAFEKLLGSFQKM
jgi:hypothetical protein